MKKKINIQEITFFGKNDQARSIKKGGGAAAAPASTFSRSKYFSYLDLQIEH